MNSNNRIAATLYSLGNISKNSLHEGDDDDINNHNNNAEFVFQTDLGANLASYSVASGGVFPMGKATSW